ncbi:MAG: hypothetical protein LLG42_00290 [Chloroflexi bacterium]|nr:hypothetical protein [Chloroflexota bacterium]
MGKKIVTVYQNNRAGEKSQGNFSSSLVEVVCLSDFGWLRENNDDNYHLGLQDGIFIVAEFCGRNERASIRGGGLTDRGELLLQILQNSVKETTNFPLRYKSIIAGFIKELNQLMNDKARKEPGLHGMGSTLILVDAANQQGGKDNIAAMLLQWTGKEG